MSGRVPDRRRSARPDTLGRFELGKMFPPATRFAYSKTGGQKFITRSKKKRSCVPCADSGDSKGILGNAAADEQEPFRISIIQTRYNMKRARSFQFLLISRVLLASFVIAGAAPGLYAAAFLVTIKADTQPGQGTCPGDNCSLRAAIEQASSLSAPEAVITLPSGTYKLTEGALRITGKPKNFVLSGAGSDATRIDGGGNPYPDDSSGSQVFEISTETVHIYGVTIQNGQTAGQGAGILINKGSSLVLGNCVVRDNESHGLGAGISNNGFLQMFNCTIERNTINAFITDAAGGGDFTSGGGIFNNVGAKVEIDSSTISDNRANRGGGIDNSGFLEITNSTISGNKVNGGGGGIRNKATGNVSIAFSTITNNIARLNGRDESHFFTSHPRTGGGIQNLGTISMGDTILALNGQPDRGISISPLDPEYSPDCYSSSTDSIGKGTFTSFRRNVIGVINQNCNIQDQLYGMETVDQPFFDKLGGPLTPLDPGLSPLDPLGRPTTPVLLDNGGPTKTHALLPGSPAIGFAGPRHNAFSDFFDTPETDQRGGLRPAGMPSDVGAFEFGTPDDITTKLKITPLAFTYNRATKQMKQTITLRNTTDRPITGQVFLVLDQLNLPLANKDGVSVNVEPKSSPYLTVVCNLSLSECLKALPPGQDKSFTLIFDDPSAQRPQYTTRVLAGEGFP